MDASKHIFNEDFVAGILSNNNSAAYDKVSRTYYFSKNLFDANNLKIVSPYKTKYKVDKYDDFTYGINIYSKKYFQYRIIKLVDSNIISIYDNSDIREYYDKDYNDIFHDRDYSDMLFEVMDNSYQNHDVSSGIQYYTGKMRIRGATSAVFYKNSYRLELNKKAAMFGMKSDDDWILDALYTDKSKIRNVLSSNLWSEINNNQIVNNDLAGEFVELFINDEYIGLYVAKERVDKKLVNVKSDGLLAKSDAHVYTTNFMDKSVRYNKNGDVYLENFELKHYTNSSLLNFKKRMTDYCESMSYDSINDNFDLDNYINYRVFLLVTRGVDNVTKNQYLSMSNENSKILITPWDMDLTFGLDYCQECILRSSYNRLNYDNVDWLYEYAFWGLDDVTIDKIAKRYFELRKNELSMSNINNYLDQYKKSIVESGSAKRDSDIWYEYDAEYEIEEIRTWTQNRLEFLDNYLMDYNRF